ncbi:hypothetical protein ELH51_27390 [Rhizobium ruizarguesonis]|uniref:hypothetical protein n=1 Tax=Rhizobium ruizarguesonis TaxID=2081791 RepID=UPI001030F488|nr:hypothetical protein [Rhizobium ruizarguesonis]TBB25208.1 hypothetical protein ELH51_27390 [Rhizobium ruizarguesonis]
MIPTEQHPRDQKVLTVTEAAAIFGRSTSWVRDEIAGGRLKTLHPAGTRPLLLTETSVQALQRFILERSRAAGGKRLPMLRLVVDNTK